MSERLGLPVLVDNDGNASMLAEARNGAAAGARHAVMVSLGTGIGGGLWLNGEVYRGATGVGARSATWCSSCTAPIAPATAPGSGASRRSSRATRSGARGCGSREAQPDSALGRRLAAEKAIDGGIVTELAHDGDPLAREVLGQIGRAARLRARRAGEHVQPRGDRDRRRRRARRGAAAGAGARGDRRACAAAGARGGARSWPRTTATRPG